MSLLTEGDKVILRVDGVQYYSSAFKILTVSEQQNAAAGELLNFCFNMHWHSPDTMPPYLIRFNWMTTMQEAQAVDGCRRLHIYAPVATKLELDMVHKFCRERDVYERINHSGVTRIYHL